MLLKYIILKKYSTHFLLNSLTSIYGLHITEILKYHILIFLITNFRERICEWKIKNMISYYIIRKIMIG